MAPSPGDLPTVEHYRGHRLTQLLVICRSERKPGYLCGHDGHLPVAGLPDLDLFTLAKTLRLRCTACGNGKVELRPDWSSGP